MLKIWENTMLSPDARLEAAVDEIQRREDQLAAVVSMSVASARAHIPAVNDYIGLLESRYEKVSQEATHWEDTAYTQWKHYHEVVIPELERRIEILVARMNEARAEGERIRGEVFGQVAVVERPAEPDPPPEEAEHGRNSE